MLFTLVLVQMMMPSQIFVIPQYQMLAKVTRIAGVVFFVVAILACLFAGRLAG